MEKSHLECPGCSGTEFHLHEITVADPQNTEDAEASSAIIICTNCDQIIGALLPPYPPPKPAYDLFSPPEGATGQARA